MFAYVPLFGWAYSLFDFKPGIPLSNTAFVGFDNFVKIIQQNKDVIRVLRNSLAMSGLGLLVSPLPIIFAIMMNEVTFKPFRKIVQTMTTLPNYISWIVIFGLAFSLFSNNGLVNTFLRNFGFESSPTGIMGSVRHVWYFQTALAVWKSLGWGTIIYLASIMGIDTEQYEAAKIDGASRWKCILYITIPGVLPTYFVLLLLAISNILNNGFDQFFVFSNPLVAERIEVLDFYVYKLAFVIKDFPYSIAIGIIKSLIGIILLFSANLFSRRIRGHSIF